MEIVLSSKAEPWLVESISVGSRSCATRLTTSPPIDSRIPSIRSLCAVSDFSSHSDKDILYHEITTLLRNVANSAIFVFARHMNAQLGRLDTSEAQLGGEYGFDSYRMDNGECLLQSSVKLDYQDALRT